MATKKTAQQQQYEAVMAELRAKQYKPVYLLMGTSVGTESYYLDSISDYVLQNVLKEEEKDFNQSLFYGSDTSMKQVVEQCKRYPMMAERQVVVFREAQQAKDFDLLEKYVANPNPSTLLVICYKGSVDGRKKYVGQLQKIGRVAAFAPLRDWELSPFITQYVREKGASIDVKASAMIAEHVGSDLKRLISEIDKILVTFPPGAAMAINPELVERCVGVSKDFNGFELRTAIAKHDVEKVNLIVKHKLSDPNSKDIFPMLSLIFGYFQNLMIAFYAPAPRNASAIMSYLGLSSEWATKDYVEGMRYYSPMKTLLIIDKIREVEGKLKGLDATANTPKSDLMKELFFFILHD